MIIVVICMCRQVCMRDVSPTNGALQGNGDLQGLPSHWQCQGFRLALLAEKMAAEHAVADVLSTNAIIAFRFHNLLWTLRP
eukprot:191113-Amphidinium_carterae.1